MTIDIRTDIPADIHPAVLGEHEDVLNQSNTVGFFALKDGLDALTQIYGTLGKLNDAIAAWEAVSPKQTTLVRGRVAEVSLPSKDLITAAERAFEGTAKIVDQQTANLNRHVNALETRVASAITDPYSKTPIGAEIRQHVKGLKADERMGFVRSLVTSGKKSDVAAILDAPSYLSGLNDETHALVRDMAAEQFAPVDHQQLRATRAVAARVERAAGHMLLAFSNVTAKKSSPAAKAGEAIRALG